MNSELIDVILPEQLRAREPRFLDWLSDHGVEALDTFRVEVYETRMLVFQFERNGSGDFYVIRQPAGYGEELDLARKEPFWVDLVSPLPQFQTPNTT